MKNHSFYHLQAVLSGKEYDESETCTVCPKTGEALDVMYDYDRILGNLNTHAMRTTPISATKYLRFYPIRDLTKLVTMSEGGTPLIKCTTIGERLGMKKLYIKNEGANPTGVFKDRGSLVELTKAREMGASAVCCASTGNMAASVSAYAAAANLPCYVFVPEGTPIGKLAQTMSYGARIIQVRGTYADCVVLCEKMAKEEGFYLAGDYAFRMEGQKSIAYEIIEQLFWRAPDVVICPVGCGTNLSGIWKGFKEFHQLGFIDKLPRMIGVQPENVPTIVEAFRQKKDRAIHIAKPVTVASAVGIGEPQDDVKVLRALHESNGGVEDASEDAILTAEQDLGRMESLFVEPSAAIPIAVLPKLLEQNVLHPEEAVVCITTGTGLKDPKTATTILPDPPVIEPSYEEVERYLEMKLYAIKGSVAKTAKLFDTMPERKNLEKIVQEEFGIGFDVAILDAVERDLKEFFGKVHCVTRADLQNIIEASLNEFSVKEKIFSIDDFVLSDSRHAQAKAQVSLTYYGEKKEEKGEGDGPFDAIMVAVKKIVGDDGLDVRLTDYNVEIATEGTAAVVKVIMELMDAQDNKIVATATSPDVIVASVNAFEKGYNILYWKGRGVEKSEERDTREALKKCHGEHAEPYTVA